MRRPGAVVSPRPGSAVRVRVPGSSANLGPGFDSVGLALGLWDEYLAGVSDEPGVRVVLGRDGTDDPDVPADERHLVLATMRRAWQVLGVAQPTGVLLVCHNTIPQGRGLGSSAAAIVAGVALAQALATPYADPADPSDPFEPTRLADPGNVAHSVVPLGLEFTNDLSGYLEGHPDNASASVFGGMTLSWQDDFTPGEIDDADGDPSASLPSVRTVQIAVHPDIRPVVLVPEEMLATITARGVLPAHLPHRDAALNGARVGLLVHAVTGHPDLLLPATRDWLHQEQRRPSLAGAMDLVDRLRARGHAAVISGAGPGVLVLARPGTIRDVVADLPLGWRAVCPGIPEVGVQAERATFEVLLRESYV
ncbi:MAG TPA: homoserine kinase [Dermatophilaceae bacterium]|nr:homoserine kinase [Dermatophilaceae bacterium]